MYGYSLDLEFVSKFFPWLCYQQKRKVWLKVKDCAHVLCIGACTCFWLRLSLNLDKVAPPQLTLWRAILSIPNLRLYEFTVYSIEGNLVINQVAPLIPLYAYIQHLVHFFSFISLYTQEIHTRTHLSASFKILEVEFFDRTQSPQIFVHLLI